MKKCAMCDKVPMLAVEHPETHQVLCDDCIRTTGTILQMGEEIAKAGMDSDDTKVRRGAAKATQLMGIRFNKEMAPKVGETMQ